MKRSILGAFVLVAAVALMATPQAFAVCAADAQPVAHGIGTFITGCPDAQPVKGYIYSLGATAVNSGAQDVICEADSGTNVIGQDCQTEAGVAGDGNVTVLEDWGASNPTVAGCPNTTGVPGDNPVVVQIVCNDGKSLMYLVGYADFYTGYLLEMAQDASATNVVASTGASPRVLSSAGNQFTIHLTDVDDTADNAGRGIYSDCDATAQGFGYSCPSPGARPSIGRGKVYFKDGACNQMPDPRLTPPAPDTPWTLAPQTALSPTGDTTATIDKAAAGSCRYVGATQTINAVETLAVSGMFILNSAGAQTDKFKVDGATFKGNDLKISFSTENESALVGFNVYAGNNKLNAGLIPAQGGSRTYSFDTTRGALKGNKAVVLEGVFADGTKSKGPAFQVK